MVDPRAGREVRLEGPVLWGATIALAAALGAVFWLGRLYERFTSPPPVRAAAGDPLRNLSRDEDVPRTDDLSFFDALSGPGNETEPARQVARPAVTPPTPAAETPSGTGSGPWFVQVFAGRDRRAAEQVVKSLGGRGHAVRLESEREGGGALFKVRVGGFASREAAEAAAETLRVREGQPGAWVVRSGG